MSDHFPAASLDGRRLRKPRTRAAAGAAERILRSRLRLLLGVLALAIAMPLGAVGVVAAAGAPSRTVWSAAAAASVLCAASFLVTGRRLAAVSAAAFHEHDAYVAGVHRRLQGLEDLVTRGWYDIAGLLAELSPGERGRLPRVSPGVVAVEESADPFDRVQQAVIRGRDEALRALAEAAAVFKQLDAQPVEMFLSIARRQHALVSRALAAIDDLEQDVEDPEQLRPLWKVDHLVTMLRRQVENVAVLGGTVSRPIDEPVLLWKILRHAVAEIQDYQRVRVVTFPVAQLRGYAVADVIHLFAELMENGAKFSSGQVLVRAEAVTAGLVVEVEDRGLHMEPGILDEMNRLLGSPDHIDLRKKMADGQLGLLVASRVARRYGIRIKLEKNLFEGTTALVVLPRGLLHVGDLAGTDDFLTAAAPMQPPTPLASTARRRPIAEPVATTMSLPRRTARLEGEASLPQDSGADAPLADRPSGDASGKPVLPVRRATAPARELPEHTERREDVPLANPDLMAAWAAGAARGASDSLAAMPAATPPGAE